jgi:RNA polymerase sigma-70 factor (sigma-E family)
VSEALRRVTASGSSALPSSRADDVLRELYCAERDKLVRLAYLLTGSQAAAEDIVQDVFIKAHTRLGEVDQPVAYLRRAVTNASWSWHRRRQVEAKHLDRRPAVVSGEHDIEMWDALARLSPRRRSVLVLRYYMDLPEQETADALGWRVGTVKSTHHRALQDLKRMLQP